MTEATSNIAGIIRRLRGAADGIVFSRSHFAAFYEAWLCERPAGSAPSCFLHALVSAFERTRDEIDGLNLADDGDALALALAGLGPTDHILFFLSSAIDGGILAHAHRTTAQGDEKKAILDAFMKALDGPKAVFKATLHSGEFEAMTSPESIWTDPGHLLPALILARRRMCVIQTRKSNGRPGMHGTGFLIGPSTVLTNHHVVRDCPEQLTSPKRLEIRFDYSSTTGLEGAEASRHYPVEDWLAAKSGSGVKSPPGAVGNWWNSDGPRNTWRQSVANDLDYAVIRLASTPGLQRGWYDLARALDPDTEDENFGCWVLHHPGGQYQTVTEGELFYTDVEDSRLFHTASTVKGSSGGLMLNAYGRPIGLHYLGLEHMSAVAEGEDISGFRVPDEVVNCAISLKSVAKDLKTKGVLDEVRRSRDLAPYRGCLDGVRPVFGRKDFMRNLQLLYDGDQPIMRVHVAPSVASIMKPGKSFTIELIKAMFRPPEHHHIVFKAGEIKVDARGQTKATLDEFAPNLADELPQDSDTTSPAFVRRLVNKLLVAIRDRLGNKTVWLMIDDLDRHHLSDASGREFLSTLYDQIGAMSNLRIVLIGLPESIEIGGLDPSKVITSSIGPDDLENRRELFLHWLQERGAREVGVDSNAEKLLSLTVDAYAGEKAPLRRMSMFASKFMSGALNEVFGEAVDKNGEAGP